MNALTVKELAELKGCTERYIKQQIQKGDYVVTEAVSTKNRKKYLIPIDTLPADLQAKYYTSLKPAVVAPEKPKRAAKKKIAGDPEEFLSGCSEAERELILWWKKLLEDWQIRRREYETLEEGDYCFIAETKRTQKAFLKENGITVSKDVLYRKYAAYKAGELAGLLDGRGGWNKGQSDIDREVLECFFTLYLDDARLPITECYKLTKEWAIENRPDVLEIFASERTFRRQVDSLEYGVVRYFRFGEKAFEDECSPYVERLYDDIEANDVWVADNHTFDIMTRSDDGEKLHRMHITAFLDAKSGALMGWNITENPCSQSTVLALRHAILRHGIPKVIYVDNGSEFLTRDFGGRGHRKRKSSPEEQPPTILELLGIEMRNALVRNARAKPIERCFLTLKNHISRLFETFTGGNIVERPESLKWQLKHGEIPFDQQLRETIDTLIQGGYNAENYGGKEARFRGMSRMQVWNQSIKRRGVRKTSEQNLDLMLLRTSRFQNVKRNGVTITISGEKLWYTSEDVLRYFDQKVYVRYDPANLETVRIYDQNDRYLATWQMHLDMLVDYLTDNPEEIATAEQKLRASKKRIKALGSELTGGKQIDRLDLAINRAYRNGEKGEIELPKIITPVYPCDEPATTALKVSGESVVINLELMNQNALLRRKT